MNKRIWLIIIFPILLGCQFLFGSMQKDHRSPATPEAASTSITQSPTDHYTSDSFVIHRVNIKNGDLLSQLAAQADQAQSLGLAPFLEFDATWCPPCQAINASIESKDALTLQAFDGVYLIRVDVDEWGWGDQKNFSVEAIPVYYKLDSKGLPSGDKIDGSAWNEDIPENFAPVLDAFFHQ